MNYTVSGASNWTATLNLNGSQTVQNSWNATVSGTDGHLDRLATRSASPS